MDRPGIGRSDPKPGRTVGDYAEDVRGVADALGLNEFAVLGYSCGGPYALAAGAVLGQRVTAAILMAGVGPLDRPNAREGLSKTDLQLLDWSVRRPWAASLYLRVTRAAAWTSPRQALNSLKKELSSIDRQALDEYGSGMMASFVESLRQGPQGVIEEYRAWSGDWGFRLNEVRPPVYLFQGDADQIVPMHHAEDMAARLANAELHRLAGEGHFSIQRRIGEILDRVPAI
jgi:pimeloyl-ACP methyl ester carboxylesterase